MIAHIERSTSGGLVVRWWSGGELVRWWSGSLVAWRSISIFFKTMKTLRIFDANNQTLMGVFYSTKVTSGGYKHGLSTVPLLHQRLISFSKRITFINISIKLIALIPRIPRIPRIALIPLIPLIPRMPRRLQCKTPNNTMAR